MRKCAVLSLLALLCFAFSATSSAKDLGVFGAVYDIAEKDALQEIEERAKEANVNRMVNRGDLAKKVGYYTPEDLKGIKLQPARKERTFLVDMTYTLDRDIADEKGSVVYPKGYTFNPLDYITYPGTLVILDGNSPTQVAWFKGSEYSKNLKAKLLITDGSYSELSKALKRPVFFVSQTIVDAFRIEALPSVIAQEGTMMKVREIAMSESKGR